MMKLAMFSKVELHVVEGPSTVHVFQTALEHLEAALTQANSPWLPVGENFQSVSPWWWRRWSFFKPTCQHYSFPLAW